MKERSLFAPLEKLWERTLDFLPNFIVAVILVLGVWLGGLAGKLAGAFLIVLGSLGLAFGLGGQDKAREIIRRISAAKED